jgi:hypothetical protein
MLRWLWELVWGKPRWHQSHFVAVRGQSSRVEELPSGRTVYYIDVTDVPGDRVEAFLKKAKADLCK